MNGCDSSKKGQRAQKLPQYYHPYRYFLKNLSSICFIVFGFARYYIYIVTLGAGNASFTSVSETTS